MPFAVTQSTPPSLLHRAELAPPPQRGRRLLPAAIRTISHTGSGNRRSHALLRMRCLHVALRHARLCLESRGCPDRDRRDPLTDTFSDPPIDFSIKTNIYFDSRVTKCLSCLPEQFRLVHSIWLNVDFTGVVSTDCSETKPTELFMY